MTVSPHFHICELRLELRTSLVASSAASQSRLIACLRATGVLPQHRNRRSEAGLPRESKCLQLPMASEVELIPAAEATYP